MQEKLFPYGAQYYRTPNPPEADWERDLREMKRQGMTIVKLWASWSQMHISEDEFDFAALDRLMEIADRVGLKVLIQIILENAPYWLVQRHPEARFVASDGQKIWPMGRPNTPGGGWPGLCLDNPPAKENAGDFITALVEHFAGHPALYGYDAWNEVWFELDGYIGAQYYCYCDGTIDRFRHWLVEKYGDLAGVSRAWRRRYSDWEQVLPPRHWGGYPDWIDWLKFRLENQGRLLAWRVETIKSIDPECFVVSHGLPTTLGGMPTQLTDDWRNAEHVDIYGLSSFPLWFKWDQIETFKCYDLTRSASRGKDFWAAEMQAGPSGEGLEHSPAPQPADIRIWNWMALSSGATGVLYWQWRPELLGPEALGFGLTNLDGSPCDRTAIASEFAKFTTSWPAILSHRPSRGEVAIAVLPESQLLNFVADKNTWKYGQAVRGTYRAFSEAGYQVDFAKIDQIEGYPLVYLPFPIAIEHETAQRLRAYVEHGGILISEACPALFGDHGMVQVPTPGYGLDEVFGATSPAGPETVSEPFPSFVWSGNSVSSAVHCQRLAVERGTALAGWPDGGAAIVQNSYGRGKGVLIGTYPGISFDWGCKSAGRMLADLAAHLGVVPSALSGLPDVWVRLHWKGDSTIAYVLNLSDEEREVCVALSADLEVKMLRDIATSEPIYPGSDGFLIRVAGKDARIFHLVRTGASEASIATQLAVPMEGCSGGWKLEVGS